MASPTTEEVELLACQMAWDHFVSPGMKRYYMVQARSLLEKDLPSSPDQIKQALSAALIGRKGDLMGIMAELVMEWLETAQGRKVR